MSRGKIKKLQVTDQQMERLAAMLNTEKRTKPFVGFTAGIEALSDNEINVRDENAMQLHLSDEQFVSYSLGKLEPPIMLQTQQHLENCKSCSEEILRLRNISRIWDNESEARRLEERIKAAFHKSDRVAPGKSLLSQLIHSVTVSLVPLLRPEGAYGEAMEEITSTVEFPITLEGAPINGLRGLLKRVNREYYVRISAIDSEARTAYGNRAAIISISDKDLEHPILQRKIDIGVTVLLGTDFRLTENSSLAVEMLPPAP